MVKKSVLLVEDDEPVRVAIRDALEREYAVLEATRLSEAVKQIDKPIDLAIIDYSLPDGNGFEVLKSLREKHLTLPAIIITAYSTEEVAIQAVRTGATDYLKKPLSLRHLLERVSLLLGGEQFSEQHDTISRREEFLMDSIAMFIEGNYREDITLDRLSAMANMSRSSFCRAFKKRFGQSCISYLNSVRIRNAAELLKNDLKLIEIAYFVGYRSVEYFNRLFKKAYGISPREYRKKIVE